MQSIIVYSIACSISVHANILQRENAMDKISCYVRLCRQLADCCANTIPCLPELSNCYVVALKDQCYNVSIDGSLHRSIMADNGPF